MKADGVPTEIEKSMHGTTAKRQAEFPGTCQGSLSLLGISSAKYFLNWFLEKSLYKKRAIIAFKYVSPWNCIARILLQQRA
jgi:hypothetical protein